MGKFLVSSATVVFSGILFGGALIHKSDASSATCGQGQQESRVRCTRLMVDKHKAKKEKQNHESRGQAGLGTRCVRLSNGSYKRGSMLPNTPPTIELRVSVDRITQSCSTSGEKTSACTTNAKVQLKSVASDADGDSLLYTYMVTGGRITGDGPEVVWDLSGLKAGSYSTTVEVDDGCGCINLTDTTVTVVACPECTGQ
jgi:hypothetical protein